jgi:hypothetical protein
MLRGSMHLGKILGYTFSPIKFTPQAAWIPRRVGRGDIWRRQWELLEDRVYNKPNGCSATGALTPGPDHHHQHLVRLVTSYDVASIVTPYSAVNIIMGVIS